MNVVTERNINGKVFIFEPAKGGNTNYKAKKVGFVLFDGKAAITAEGDEAHGNSISVTGIPPEVMTQLCVEWLFHQEDLALGDVANLLEEILDVTDLECNCAGDCDGSCTWNEAVRAEIKLRELSLSQPQQPEAEEHNE